MLRTQVFTKTTMKFWKNIIEVIWKMSADKFFKYFWVAANSSVIIPCILERIFEYSFYICIIKGQWKFKGTPILIWKSANIFVFTWK